MKLNELPKPIQWLLSTYEMFRRLEFEPEELFFGCDGDTICLELRHGNETFVCANSSEGMSEESFLSIWPEASEAWNNADDKEALALFESSQVMVGAPEVIAALIMKGITPPAIIN